jgi:hypothetical protein
MVELQDYYSLLYNAHCNSINVYRKTLNILSIESLDWKRSHCHLEGKYNQRAREQEGDEEISGEY